MTDIPNYFYSETIARSSVDVELPSATDDLTEDDIIAFATTKLKVPSISLGLLQLQDSSPLRPILVLATPGI